MYTPPAFSAAMHIGQFMLIVQTERDMGDTLRRALERAERIHEAFFGSRRYADIESAEQAYYTYTRKLIGPKN